MKKVFILYDLGDGKALKIEPTLDGIMSYVRNSISDFIDGEGAEATYTTSVWVNEYEEGQETISICLNEILDAFDRGEQPEDLSFF